MSDVGDERASMTAQSYEMWKGWSELSFGRCSEEKKYYFQMEVFQRLAGRSKLNIIEVGFGGGEFLGCAKDLGHKVTGVETNETLRSWAENAGYEAYGSIDLVSSLAYDAAVVFDVLEHISANHAIAFLREISRTLAPGGLIILRFPNGDSPFGRANQHGDVTHINDVGSDKLRYFALGAGLSVLELANQANSLGHLRIIPRIRAELTQLVRSGVEVVLGKLFFHRRIPLSSNMIAVLQKPST